jgi:hypothetical protein
MRLAPVAAALALFAAPAAFSAPALAADFTVVVDGKAHEFTADQLSKLPRGEATMPYKGKPRAFSGPLLSFVLREAGAPGGAKLHGPVMKSYLVVTGADGFEAVLSLAEADKDFHDGAVILADTADGAKLPEREGPYRLVVQGDRKGSRSVYKAVKAEVRTAD